LPDYYNPALDVTGCLRAREPRYCALSRCRYSCIAVRFVKTAQPRLAPSNYRDF